MSNYNNPRKHLKTRDEERNILEEFFNSSNFISNIKKEQGKKRKPKKLASLLLSDDSSHNNVDSSLVINYDNSESEAKYEYDMDSVSLLQNPLNDPLLEIISKIQPNGEQHDQNHTLKNILSSVIRLHNEVNDVSLSLIHRKSLHDKLTTANKQLLAAFEEMLHTCHDMYKDKIKTQADKINHLLFHSNLVESQLLTQRSQSVTFKDCMDSLRSDKEKLEALLKSKETQIQILSQRIAQLEEVRVDYIKCLEEFHTLNKQEKRQKKELDVDLELEDMRLKYKQLQDEMKIEMRNLTMQTEVQQNKTQRLEMTMKAKALAASRLVHTESQTVVNDSGLWDVSDGWVLPVSGTALARNRWRQCIGFSMCKACKGQGSYIAKIANLLKATLRGEVEDVDAEDYEDSDVSAASTPVAYGGHTPNSVSNKSKDKLKIFQHNNNNNSGGGGATAKNKNITKDGELWRLPDDLVQFMVHVPRTAMAMRPFTSNRLLGAVWTLFRLKARADAEDELLGYPMQSLADFLVEAYLQSFGLRSKAEIGLFLLLHSIQEHHSSYPLLKFFARAIGAIRKRKSRLHNKKKSSTSSSSSSKSMTVIPVSVLTVYLMARERLFRPYRGRYHHAIEKIKEGSKELQNAQKQLQITENLMSWSSSKEPALSASSRCTTPDSIASATVTHRITSFIQNKLEEDTSSISSKYSSNNLSISRNPSNNNKNATNANGAINSYQAATDIAANVSVPSHIVVTSHPCQFWVPVDRAIQVSRAVLSYMTDSEFSLYARLLEGNVKFLTKYGNVEKREVSNSEVHTEVRDYILSTDSKLRNIKERKAQLDRIRRNQSFKIKSTFSNNNLSLKKIAHKNSGILRMSSTEEKNNSNNDDDYSLLILDNNNYNKSKYSTNIKAINEENSLSPNDKIHRMNSNSNINNFNDSKLEKRSSSNRLESLRQIPSSTTPNTASLQRLNSQKEISDSISRTNSIENNKSYDSHDYSVMDEVFTKNINNDKKREQKNNNDNAEDENDFRNFQKMPLVISVDFVLESLVDILMTIAKSEEDQLKTYFNEGDDNGDGVLSFSEFLVIVSKVAPHLSKRKILKMFREALLICQTGDCLDPASFITVCKQHGLVSLVNLEILKEDELLT